VPPERAAVTGAVPSPKSNVTVPVGVLAPRGAAATVAVKVTSWPVTEASGSALTTVADTACVTAWVLVAVEGVKLGSPL